MGQKPYGLECFTLVIVKGCQPNLLVLFGAIGNPPCKLFEAKEEEFRAETHSCLTVNEGYVVMYACIQQVRLNLWGMHIHVVLRVFSAMHALFRQHVG